MPGLDPGIHLLREKLDWRVKPGNDNREALRDNAPRPNAEDAPWPPNR
jgi:hypothetical protein